MVSASDDVGGCDWLNDRDHIAKVRFRDQSTARKSVKAPESFSIDRQTVKFTQWNTGHHQQIKRKLFLVTQLGFTTRFHVTLHHRFTSSYIISLYHHVAAR